jgi:hypothetical protein
MSTNPNPAVSQSDSNTAGKKPKIDWTKMVPNLIYGAIAALLLVVIVWGLSGERGFLESLGDRTVARGLITFLITFTTIGIAIILAISTLFSSGTLDGDKRFDQGKQVLTVLIGILGTIVGFYFGSSSDTKAMSTSGPQVLTIAPAAISNMQPKKGEKFTISTFVSGGKPPYVYSITFDSPLITAIKDVKSTDGGIKQEIAVPDTLTADTEVKYLITVTDSDNKAGDYNKDGAQKISLKVK